MNRTVSVRFRQGLLALFAAAALAGCGDHLKAHGNIVDRVAPDFRLHDTSRTPFVLSAQRGNVVVIFFGYTHCGDVCPTTLAHVAQAVNRLGKEAAKSIKTLFITVDPRRDTPTVTTRYARQFHPSFIGLSGSPNELTAVEHAYQVWAKAMPAHKNGSYEVAHSSEIFLLAPNGHVRIIEDWDVPVGDLSDDLRALR